VSTHRALFFALHDDCDSFPDMSEKKYDKDRQSVRQPIPTLVDIELEDGTFRHDFSENISEGGMYLSSEKPLAPRTRMTLRFTLPNLDWVFEIKAEVLWSVTVTMEERLDGKKSGMALKFTEMDAEDSEKIKTYFKNFKIEDLEL
jgi:type IV pilus assembly protein PilZ